MANNKKVNVDMWTEDKKLLAEIAKEANIGKSAKVKRESDTVKGNA